MILAVYLGDGNVDPVVMYFSLQVGVRKNMYEDRALERP